MKIAFDASDLCANQSDGTTRYTRELVRHLPLLGPSHTWHMLAQCNLPNKDTNNTKWHAKPWSHYWTQTRMWADLYSIKPDVLFMPIQQLPAIRPRQTKTIAVIHDLAYHYYPEQYQYKDWLLLNIFGSLAIHEADALICVSQATADDVAKFYGRTKNVHVVHHGVDHERFTPHEGPASDKLIQTYPVLTKPYILYLGQIQPRKNLIRLMDAFETIASTMPDMQLVIAGGHGWHKKPIVAAADASPVRDRIHMLGKVDDALLPDLYAHASVFVLPSLYEGFGIPVLEAMACGAPVVTSDTSSMPEIAGDAAVLVNPSSVDDIARGIREAYSMRESLREKGIAQAQQFTWETTARKTLDVIAGVV